MPGSTAAISAAAVATDPRNSTINNAATGGVGNSVAAVSATKKNNENDNTHRYHDDNADNCSVYSSSTHATMATQSPLSDCLCWALYRPNVNNNNKSGTVIRKRNKGILWPALRFSSISDFLSVKGESFDASTSSTSSSDTKKMKKKKKNLAKRVMKEALYGRAIHTISFLGRPVDEYVTADESEKKGVKVQDYINGLASFSRRRKRPDFTQKFISLCDSSCGGGGDDDDNRGEVTTAAAFDLFQDFYKALDEAVAINRTDDDMDDSSQDDSDDDDDDDVAWASKAQKDWDEYQSLGGGDGNGRGNGVAVSSASRSSSSQNDDDDDDEDEDAVVAGADAALAAPNYPQQEQVQEHAEYHHNNDHQDVEEGEEENYQQQDDISFAQSTAAVSVYTEASTTSAASTSRSGNMGGHHQQQHQHHHQTPVKESSPSIHPPSKLSNVNEGDDFDTCWNNHELEGWEQFDDNGQIVYRAPNGYTFSSHQCFCEYLTKTYGWVDPNAKKRASRSSGVVRGRPSSRCLTERQRSYSPDAKKRWSTLWSYLTHTLGWTYNFATANDAKIHGATTIWFRPERNLKVRGELGRDHFFKEDDVVTYCDENDITPPPPSPAEELEEEEEEESSLSAATPEMEMKEKVVDQYPNGTKISKLFDGTWYSGKVRSYNRKNGFYRIKYEDGDLEVFNDADMRKWLKVDDDVCGYDTPDDQSTVPQDPGKPRLPSPSEATNASSSSNGSNGSSSLYGLSASYCDEDRYDFKILWKHLKEKGWTWKRAKNQFEDYWWIRPVSMRPEKEWLKGLDYFSSQEEVVAFCKARDNGSIRKKVRGSRNKNDDAKHDKPSKNKKKIPPKKKVLKKKKSVSSNNNGDVRDGKSRQFDSNRNMKKGQINDDIDNAIRDDTPSNKKRKNSKKTPTKKTEKGKKDSLTNNNDQSDSKKRRKDTTTISIDLHGEKSNKKQKGSSLTKPTKTKPKLSYLCNDENLKISDKDDDAPWTVNKPKSDHMLCIKATGMTYTSFYYLPGEDNKKFTTRFSTVEQVAQHFARTGEYTLSSSGSKNPSTDVERSFVRLVRYALVPGSRMAWKGIRKINRSETSYLLAKLGYRRTNGDVWETPDVLVVADILKPQYKSLNLLCGALICLNDLDVPPSAASRRRKQESSLSQTQLMALRLRIAEGFTKLDKKYNDHDYESEEETVFVKKDLPSVTSSTKNRSDEAIKATRNNNDTSDDECKKRKRMSKEIEEEKRKKELDAQIAWSPTKIKVGQFRKNPEDNTAPWATMNPMIAPRDGWSNFYYKTGCSYSSANYYMPGESTKSFTVRFSSTNDIQPHVCTDGEYSKYLNPLSNEEDRRFLKRHFNYGHVPGFPSDWKQLRKLELSEVVIFLELLGFQKGRDRWWSVPEGLAVLDTKKRYRSLSDLGKALIRVPDLEDRTQGIRNRRRAKSGERILSDHQIMALRLRIAEGLENEEPPSDVDMNSVSDNTSNVEENPPSSDEESDSDSNEENTMTEEKALKLFFYDTCSHGDVWSYLQNLGCSYRRSHYHLPRQSKSTIECQNDLVLYILENSVNVLDWENCSLTPCQVERLERYLKGFTARRLVASVVGQAFHEITKTNIKKILSKIGIVRRKNDEYYIGDEKHNESSIINMIRSTIMLHGLGQNASSPSKRCRSSNATLTTLEVSTLRLWAVKSDLPLTNMPDLSTIGIGQSTNKNDNKDSGDSVQAVNSEEMSEAVNDVENKSTLVESNKMQRQLNTIDSNECNRTVDEKYQIEASQKVNVQSSTLDEDEDSSTNEKVNEVDVKINDGAVADSDEMQGINQQQKSSSTPSSIAEDETKEDLEVTATGTVDDVDVDFKTPPPKNRTSTSSDTNITTTTSKEQGASSLLSSVGDDDRKPKSTHERRRHNSLSSATEDDCEEFSTPNESLEHEHDKDLIMGESESENELLEPATENNIDNTTGVVHHSSDSNGENNDKGTWGLSTQPPDTDDDDDDDDGGATQTQPSYDDNESILDMSEPAKLTPPSSTAINDLNHHDHDHERRTEQRCNRAPLFTQEDDDALDVDEFMNS